MIEALTHQSDVNGTWLAGLRRGRRTFSVVVLDRLAKARVAQVRSERVMLSTETKVIGATPSATGHGDLEGRDAAQPRIGRRPRSLIQSLH
jgi:hypothetical protein